MIMSFILVVILSLMVLITFAFYRYYKKLCNLYEGLYERAQTDINNVIKILHDDSLTENDKIKSIKHELDSVWF